MEQAQKPIIELKDVSFSYEAHRPALLSDINLSIMPGSFTAITGPNGGGKTTLLRLILKLLKPTAGEVIYRMDNELVKRLPIGYLPQKSMIDSRFPITVREVLLSGLLHGVYSRPNEADIARLQEVMELTGCSAFASHTIGELSGGQLQRTLLGRAIISRPKVIVLDEPLSYVDKQFEKQIYSLMEQLAQNTTIILVSHEMSIISGMASQHVIVDHGLHICSASHHYIPNDCL